MTREWGVIYCMDQSIDWLLSKVTNLNDPRPYLISALPVIWLVGDHTDPWPHLITTVIWHWGQYRALVGHFRTLTSKFEDFHGCFPCNSAIFLCFAEKRGTCMSLCTTALNKEHMPLNLNPRDQIEVKAHDNWFSPISWKQKKNNLTSIIECTLSVVFK